MVSELIIKLIHSNYTGGNTRNICYTGVDLQQQGQTENTPPLLMEDAGLQQLMLWAGQNEASVYNLISIC